MPDNMKPPTGIQAILIDFGGVLAEEGFREGLQFLARKQHLDPETVSQAGRKAVHDSGYILGIGSESDFWQLLRQRTGLVGTDSELTHEILSRFTLRSWMIEYIKFFRMSGITTVILSDQTNWLDQLDDLHHFSHHFDKVYNSYYKGKSKQDPSLFDDITTEIGVLPENTLFIDDDPGHIQRAINRGLKTILYKNREDFTAQLKSLVTAVNI